MAAARKGSRWGHRDATMILIGYRHGLRASELCDLQWSQVELSTGRLHVRRAKNGSPSVHPMQGDEIRALRRLQREQGPSSHVFMTERGGPMTPKAFHAMFGRIGGARQEIAPGAAPMRNSTHTVLGQSRTERDASLAEKDKCLAQSNKSGTAGAATKRQAENS